MVWICLKDVFYVLLDEIQKTCSSAKTIILSSCFNLIFIYEQWLVFTAS